MINMETIIHIYIFEVNIYIDDNIITNININNRFIYNLTILKYCLFYFHSITVRNTCDKYIWIY